MRYDLISYVLYRISQRVDPRGIPRYARTMLPSYLSYVYPAHLVDRKRLELSTLSMPWRYSTIEPPAQTVRGHRNAPPLSSKRPRLLRPITLRAPGGI